MRTGNNGRPDPAIFAGGKTIQPISERAEIKSGSRGTDQYRCTDCRIKFFILHHFYFLAQNRLIKNEAGVIDKNNCYCRNLKALLLRNH